MNLGIAIITHTAKKHLPHCLPPLLTSPLNPKVLVVNSSSHDGTVELAQSMGAETLVIPRQDFNHGTTRELARRHLNTDIVLMLTPDAYFVDPTHIESLIAPLIQKKASVAYARQIPRKQASFFEAFPREFNYPNTSHIRGLDDKEIYGVYTFFCSNSCAAYLNAALDEIGGFESVLLGEDTLAVMKLLEKGHRIAYVAEALVEHSHDYSLKQEFARHFDIGLTRKIFKTYLDKVGSDSDRGKLYVREMFRQLKNSPSQLLYALGHVCAKWLGYQMGLRSSNAPLWLKKCFSSQDFYWNSNEFLKNN